MPDILPTIITDTREQAPLKFERLTSTRGTLPTGDYSVAGLEDHFAIERKSVADLVSCCIGQNRERFERELVRIRGYRFARLVIIGENEAPMFTISRHGYRSNIAPAAVLGTIAAFEARYCPVVCFPDPVTAADAIERWAVYFSREVQREAKRFTDAHKHLTTTPTK